MAQLAEAAERERAAAAAAERERVAAAAAAAAAVTPAQGTEPGKRPASAASAEMSFGEQSGASSLHGRACAAAARRACAVLFPLAFGAPQLAVVLFCTQ